MREIKFRAWNKRMKRMEPTRAFDTKQFPVMQFTGLLDKNGKEIYEGDILSAGDGGIFTVDFPYAAWAFSATPSSKYIAYPAPWSNAKRMEIIGNIYENPELSETPHE